LSLDAMSLETRHRLEPMNDAGPDKRFEREWAIAVLEQALKSMRAEYAAADKEALFEELKGFLTGDGGTESYACVGARLGLSEGATKVAIHRLRRRYRAKLNEEIAQTVSSPEEVNEEIRSLFAAFG
jgi:RNA polymerase sigma-70 factor (ECF subfamily)